MYMYMYVYVQYMYIYLVSKTGCISMIISSVESCGLESHTREVLSTAETP